jgi:HD-like signal output (HDOD) protein
VLEHFYRNRPGPSAFPALSLEILNLIAGPEVDVAALSRLIGRDPGMAAGVLRVANSAAYHALSPVETLREAIARLGLNEVAKVAGAISARTLFNPRARAELQVFGARWNALFHDAATTAMAAAALAMRSRGARSDLCYLGGMLHDVGRSIALRSVAALVLDGALARELPAARLDRVLDRVHVEVGGECHQEWTLPSHLTALCVRHHEEHVAAEPELAGLHVVRLASAVHLLRQDAALHRGAPAEIADSAAALSLDPRQVRALDAEVRLASAKVEQAFAVEPRAGRRARPAGA